MSLCSNYFNNIIKKNCYNILYFNKKNNYNNIIEKYNSDYVIFKKKNLNITDNEIKNLINLKTKYFC